MTLTMTPACATFDKRHYSWENGILYILKGIEETAEETPYQMHGKAKHMAGYKQKIHTERPIPFHKTAAIRKNPKYSSSTVREAA